MLKLVRMLGPALLVCLGQWALGKTLVHQEQQPWLQLMLSIVAVLWGFLLLRFALPPVSAALWVLVVDLALHLAHHTNSALTGEPLSWSDLSQTENLGIVGQYITVTQTALTLALLLGLVVWTRHEARQPYLRTRLLSRTLWWLLLGPLALQPWWPQASTHLARWLAQTPTTYVQWNWASNVQANGLPLHLLQTSKRPMSGPARHGPVPKSRRPLPSCKHRRRNRCRHGPATSSPSCAKRAGTMRVFSATRLPPCVHKACASSAPSRPPTAAAP